MATHESLSGRWTGHYYQHDQLHPIEAELVQKGATLAGLMRDLMTDRDASVFEAAAEAGLPPGADEQIVAKIRAMVPEETGGQVRFITHLPTDSLLEGTVEGRNVKFLKSYQGVAFNGYRLGESLVVNEHLGLAVHYEGRLSLDGGKIEGSWWIDANREMGVKRVHGEFTLNAEDPIS